MIFLSVRSFRNIAAFRCDGLPERPTTMEQGKRGLPLTLFAIAFGLLAIADLTKPLSKTPGVGLVFFGTKLNGTADLIIAPLFAAFLAIYAIGIWRMKRYALPMSHAYATYVFINLLSSI